MSYDFGTPPAADQRCETCRYYLDYRATEGDDWADGYCGHPDHFNASKSEHAAYGGHWTNHLAWCGWWTKVADQPEGA
jgi:hypothetical protein